MDIFDWLTITLVCFIGAITPGPSLIVIIYITNSKKVISGLLASLGHGLGIFLYALVSIYIKIYQGHDQRMLKGLILLSYYWLCK